MDYTHTNCTGNPHSNRETVTHQLCHDIGDKNHTSLKSKTIKIQDHFLQHLIPNRSVKSTRATAQSIFMTEIKGSFKDCFYFIEWTHSYTKFMQRCLELHYCQTVYFDSQLRHIEFLFQTALHVARLVVKTLDFSMLRHVAVRKKNLLQCFTITDQPFLCSKSLVKLKGAANQTHRLLPVTVLAFCVVDPSQN